MRKLIEEYRRNPDFTPESGTPIRLCDGQEWRLPRPMVELTPVIEGVVELPGGATTPRVARFNRNVTLGEDLDLLVRAIGAEEDPPRRVHLVMTLGALLLKRNYDLTDEECGRLFRYRVGDPESEAMLREIMDVATGRITSFSGATA